MIFTMLCSLAFGLYYSMTNNVSSVMQPEDIVLIQLDEPEAGAPIAVIHTTAGDMTYLLYPEEAPQTVANFCQLAESGFYDGTYVFRVEPEVFFCGGAAAADGSLGDSAEAASEQIPQELSPKLWPLRGALCALTTSVEGGFWKTLTGRQKTYTGSRFLVCDTVEMNEEMQEALLADENEGAQRVAEAFIEYGGIPNYSQQLTVFGQLIEGSEILDAITDCEVTGDPDSARPAEDILITGIEIGTYGS